VIFWEQAAIGFSHNLPLCSNNSRRLGKVGHCVDFRGGMVTNLQTHAPFARKAVKKRLYLNQCLTVSSHVPRGHKLI